jgi:hypothetical protein
VKVGFRVKNDKKTIHIKWENELELWNELVNSICGMLLTNFDVSLSYDCVSLENIPYFKIYLRILNNQKVFEEFVFSKNLIKWILDAITIIFNRILN